MAEPDNDDKDIAFAMDMPEILGKCAFLGGYVDDGEAVCYFGREYLCVAPKLIPTGHEC